MYRSIGLPSTTSVLQKCLIPQVMRRLQRKHPSNGCTFDLILYQELFAQKILSAPKRHWVQASRLLQSSHHGFERLSRYPSLQNGIASPEEESASPELAPTFHTGKEVHVCKFMQVQQLGHWRQLAHDGDQHPETFVAKFETANQIPLRHVSPDSRGKCRKYRNGKRNWTCPEILNVTACESYGPFFGPNCWIPTLRFHLLSLFWRNLCF